MRYAKGADPFPPKADQPRAEPDSDLQGSLLNRHSVIVFPPTVDNAGWTVSGFTQHTVKPAFCRSAAHSIKEGDGMKGASMKKVEKILAPTDLSEISRIGLSYAFDLARGWGAELTVYHVTDAAELANYKATSLQDLIEKRTKALAQYLSDHFAELLPLVELRTQVDIGSAADLIVAEAEKQGSDLIVMSTHGRTGLAHILMGSVTEHVVRNANCPVFSVHPPRAK